VAAFHRSFDLRRVSAPCSFLTFHRDGGHLLAGGMPELMGSVSRMGSRYPRPAELDWDPVSQGESPALGSHSSKTRE
jgi:hypothetical protein